VATSARQLDLPQGIPNRNAIALVNLIMRHTPTRVTVVQLGEHEEDPEMFVVTSIDWRDRTRPLLGQLPKVLSYLETMRGTRGVPSKVYLESDEGMQLYIPTSTRASEIPSAPRDAAKYLKSLVSSTCSFIHSTAKEVEETFWSIAMKRGFSPDIVGRMAAHSKGFESSANIQRFNSLMHRYFSVRFTIHTAESILHLEDTVWQEA
jgi:hypothetical protein